MTVRMMMTKRMMVHEEKLGACRLVGCEGNFNRFCLLESCNGFRSEQDREKIIYLVYIV